MLPVLTVENLCAAIHSGDRQINPVRNVTFRLFPGRTLALVGESGCGKA